MTTKKMKVRILNTQGALPGKASLLLWVRSVFKELVAMGVVSKPEAFKSVNLVFVTEERMRNLNKSHRKHDKATDILSFAPSEEGSLGEIALCLPVIQRKSKKDRLDFWLEYLVLHGLLHLLGFDHEKSKAEAKKMYQLQDTVFNKLKPK